MNGWKSTWAFASRADFERSVAAGAFNDRLKNLEYMECERSRRPMRSSSCDPCRHIGKTDAAIVGITKTVGVRDIVPMTDGLSETHIAPEPVWIGYLQ